MTITKFEDLKIWKLGIKLTKDIYAITNRDRLSKDFCLKDHLRKSAISISSNIAEGFERNNNNEFIRFLIIAKGSIGETKSQLFIARELKYINQKDFGTLNKDLNDLINQTGSLISYLKIKKQLAKSLTR